jgi:hypothetical protein
MKKKVTVKKNPSSMKKASQVSVVHSDDNPMSRNAASSGDD